VNPTSKTKAFWGVLATAISTFLGHVAEINPSLQDKFIVKLQVIFPVEWRPEIAAIMDFIAFCAIIYTIMHAARSGPQTAPANPAN
jgi:DUF1009 family protein